MGGEDGFVDKGNREVVGCEVAESDVVREEDVGSGSGVVLGLIVVKSVNAATVGNGPVKSGLRIAGSISRRIRTSPFDNVSGYVSEWSED